MNTPEIIRKIFEQHKFTDFFFDLSESYAPREYCVQYRETDFDFVSRLMEEEGIFYYFKHSKDKHILTICDSPSGYHTLEETDVRYMPVGQTSSKQLTGWRHVYEFRPGNIAQKDFNFKKPSDGLVTDQGSRVNYERSADLEVYEYPGLYEDSGRGKRLTKVRMEEIEAEHDHVVGSGYYLNFTPGGKFEVAQHMRSSEQGRSYALLEVYTEFHSNLGFESDSGDDFRNEFKCIPSETTFRPPRNTPKPVVEGPQTAIVATDGQEIVVDEHARVKVQFHWDRYGQKDINSSCWIRVSQVHAGKGWGMIDIPRQNEEVIVSFLEGDPDRPIITGRVYNGENQSPYGLKGAGDNSKNKTRRGNTTKSYESGGYNEMTMDDTAGQEQIRIHGQNNMDTTVQNDQTVTVNNNRTKTIAVDETNSIGNNRMMSIGVNDTASVGTDQSLTVGSNQTVSVGATQSTSVGSMQTNNVGMVQNEMIGIAGNQMIGVAKAVTVGAIQNQAVGAMSTEQVGLIKNTIVGSEYKISVGSKFEISCGASKIIMESSGKITIEAPAEMLIKGGGATIQMAGGIIDLN
jgi:type VI secretion system secreted protein VgrG